MSGFDGDEHSATGSANFVVRDQLTFNRRAIFCRVNNTSDESHWTIGWRRPQQLDRVFRRHCARRLIRGGSVHQVPGGGPVAMTIEQRTDDAAAQHAFKRFVLATRLPFGNDFFAVRKAANV